MAASFATSITASRVTPSRIPASAAAFVQDTFAYQEDICARTLGHFTLMIQHQGFNATSLNASILARMLFEIVQRLDPRADAPPEISLHAT